MGGQKRTDKWKKLAEIAGMDKEARSNNMLSATNTLQGLRTNKLNVKIQKNYSMQIVTIIELEWLYLYQIKQTLVKKYYQTQRGTFYNDERINT